jgi:acetyl-CoA carboxylase biotin carboxyl carrier protein
VDIPLKQLKQLLKTLEDAQVLEFEYEDEKHRVKLTLGRAAPVGLPVVSPAPRVLEATPAVEPGGVAMTLAAEGDFVTSPFVGTFYRASSPDGDPFVKEGSVFSAGQTLCIVEAMKLMNEIEAEFSGTITEVLVENGKSVEYGQKLFKVKR